MAQSVRWTETPEPRVTKPMMASPGTGVQQRANFTQTSGSPATMTPGSPASRLFGLVTTSPADSTSSRPPTCSTRRFTTESADIRLSPISAYKADTSFSLRSWAISVSSSGVSTSRMGRFRFLMARFRASLPRSIASSRRSLENHDLIFVFARGLLTNWSQSRLGPEFSSLLVKISTTSPLFRVDSRATSRPLTRAPTQRWPTSVCTE